MAVVFVLLLLNDTVIIEILQLNCYNSKCSYMPGDARFLYFIISFTWCIYTVTEYDVLGSNFMAFVWLSFR
jgi:hypothetical protein